MIYYVVSAAYDDDTTNLSTAARTEDTYDTVEAATNAMYDIIDNPPRPDLEVCIYDERGRYVEPWNEDDELGIEPCPECGNVLCTCYNSEEQ